MKINKTTSGNKFICCLVILTVATLIPGCSEEEHTAKHRRIIQSSVNHAANPRKAELVGIKNKNVVIGVVAVAPKSLEEPREYLLISSDSVFNSIVRDKRNNTDYFRALYFKYWNTDFDWYVNSLLYGKFLISAYGMSAFAPDKVEEWRKSNKKEVGEMWKQVLDTLK